MHGISSDLLDLQDGFTAACKTAGSRARNIKEGNLDFEIKNETNDEIGQLCQDFEEMRLRLKANAEEKVAYDKREQRIDQ